ncbi:MAG: gluconate transporter [Saprospiraceae bacterium]|nr:gluconate transporter [Saprospiraceae bacterium]
MPLIYLLIGILFLIFLTLKKVNPFVALILAALATGLIGGMDVGQMTTALEKGIGQTLGSTLLTLVLGGAYGSLLERTGVIQRLTQSTLHFFGSHRVQWAILVISFLVGLPLFYNAAFILLYPLIVGLVHKTGLPVRYLALPMVAALSITHALLPPHPAPTTLAALLVADPTQTLLWGLIIALPAAIMGGPVLSAFFKNSVTRPLLASQQVALSLPNSTLAFTAALLPIVLMTLGSLNGYISQMGIKQVLLFCATPSNALLSSLLFTGIVLGLNKNHPMEDLMKWMYSGMESVFMILLIIAAGGAFKEVLVGIGVAETLSGYAAGWSVHPLLYGYLLAAVIRVSIGSATVAALTAAGLIAPAMAEYQVAPELMVLAIGSGSIFCSHLNDAGFWMFKEFFNLSVKETLMSWTLMETCISVLGISGVMTIHLLIC